MSIYRYVRIVVGLSLAAAFLGCSAPKKAAEAAVKVTDIALGRSVTENKSIAEKTDSFRPSDTFYLSVKTDGSGPSATLTARWTYEDGQVVDESTQNIAPTGGATATEFHVSKPDAWPSGGYKVEVLLNGTSAGTRDFKVS
jgi:hypothetical protein